MHLSAEWIEHHVAIAKENLSDIIVEAFEGYMGWATYLHG
jgi:hypothetical protein